MAKKKLEVLTISENWYKVSDFLQFNISLKFIAGKQYIDVRKWNTWNGNEIRPTRNGICIRASDWINLIPILEKTIEEAENDHKNLEPPPSNE